MLWCGPATKQPDPLYVVLSQGLGDCIQYARWLERLDTSRVTIAGGHAELGPLLRKRWPDLALAPGAPPEGATWVPLHHLPRIFFDPELSKPRPGWLGTWKGNEPDYGGPFRIGIAWQGNPRNPLDMYRSMSPRTIASIALTEGSVEPRERSLVSLQGHPGADDCPAHVCQPKVHNLEALERTIKDLDAVVTVDSMIGHLAGAMGCPVLLVLPPRHLCDARWLGHPHPYPRTHELLFTETTHAW